jgi:hypothetical protein
MNSIKLIVRGPAEKEDEARGPGSAPGMLARPMKADTIFSCHTIITAPRSFASGCLPGPSVQASPPCSTGREMASHGPPHSLESACRQCSHGRQCCDHKQSVREALPITGKRQIACIYLLTAVGDDARHKLATGIVLVVVEADGALAKTCCTCRQAMGRGPGPRPIQIARPP